MQNRKMKKMNCDVVNLPKMSDLLIPNKEFSRDQINNCTEIGGNKEAAIHKTSDENRNRTLYKFEKVKFHSEYYNVFCNYG